MVQRAQREGECDLPRVRTPSSREGAEGGYFPSQDGCSKRALPCRRVQREGTAVYCRYGGCGSVISVQNRSPSTHLGRDMGAVPREHFQNATRLHLFMILVIAAPKLCLS